MRFVVHDSKGTYPRRIGARKVKMKKGEWSDWEERHRRLSDEGRSE